MSARLVAASNSASSRMAGPKAQGQDAFAGLVLADDRGRIVGIVIAGLHVVAGRSPGPGLERWRLHISGGWDAATR
ncbi:hypothetical protein [Brevundimonas sp.]|uniref:hypothetical protein n=1 Tax=Brevundimonas sp. TaxID=1871086 RepID=UPI00286A1499|nr:hypothetical protein [Brevundimonas sp.]